MRYLLLPRFWVLRRGPVAGARSQSTRTMGNFTRLGEKVLFLYASENGAGQGLGQRAQRLAVALHGPGSQRSRSRTSSRTCRA